MGYTTTTPATTVRMMTVPGECVRYGDSVQIRDGIWEDVDDVEVPSRHIGDHDAEDISIADTDRVTITGDSGRTRTVGRGEMVSIRRPARAKRRPLAVGRYD